MSLSSVPTSNCANCGGDVYESDKHCRTCGAKIDSVGTINQESSQKEGGSLGYILKIGGVLVFLGGFGLMFAAQSLFGLIYTIGIMQFGIVLLIIGTT